MKNDIVADVIVIGSGIAGALAAHQLATKGVKVAILEAGPHLDRGQVALKYQRSTTKDLDSPYPNPPEALHPQRSKPDGYYRQMGPDLFRSTYQKAVGGTTWHWLGTTFRYRPEDFRVKALYGSCADWPLTYDELEPYYAKAEQALGVAGDSNETYGSPRSTPYPLPPIPLSYVDKVFQAALTKSKYKVSPTPQARNSVFHDGRPACCGSASCIPVCPVQAKYDATVHVRKALQSGAELHDRCTAVAVELGGNGEVSSIRFKRWDGSTGHARGKRYVIAAHAIETPRLLLASRTNDRPSGVANSSGMVGRNLMDHPSKVTSAMSPVPVYPMRGPLSTSGIENLRDGAFRRSRAAFRIDISNTGHDGYAGQVKLVADLVRSGKRGGDLNVALSDIASRQVTLVSLVEQDPDPENRVTLDPAATDMYGVPFPRIHYRLSDYVNGGLQAAEQVHEDVFSLMGATQVSHASELRGAGHIIGTMKMGTDPKSSVVDGWLRSHDCRNLFVVGSSVFPTSGTVNPTLTIAALSLRMSEAILRDLRT